MLWGSEQVGQLASEPLGCALKAVAVANFTEPWWLSAYVFLVDFRYAF